MRILGISAFYHDSAAALLIDGNIAGAVQEERFTRKKNDSSFPTNAIQYCLQKGKTRLDELDRIIFYEKPFLKFERLIETYLSVAPAGLSSFLASMPIWLREKLFQKRLISNELLKIAGRDIDLEQKILFSEHHMSHSASAFYPSPFEEAVILTLDGVGEWATTSVAIGKKETINIDKEIHFPHSLGLLYSSATYFCGFKVNSGEYKLMGLAPYGKPIYTKFILDSMIDVRQDGSFRLNMRYFNYCAGLTMTSQKFHEAFNALPRKPHESITQLHLDVAASFQQVLEITLLKITRALAREYSTPNLCLAGGVALNCVANTKIQRDGAFKNLWVQPAAGDAGGALGAAYTAYYTTPGIMRKSPRKSQDAMKNCYLGPDFAQAEIETELKKLGAHFQVLSQDRVIHSCALALRRQAVVGWFQGRMEFGQRALGSRSILADPRSPLMQKQLNMKIKFRESFRPFAPAILAEDVKKWFNMNTESPYMMFVAEILNKHKKKITKNGNRISGFDGFSDERSVIPAVTHVDYSSRIQTVHKKTNPLFHKLISKFKDFTGCPILVNTSFNVRGEPIVNSPADAYHCFMNTDLDMLVIGNCILHKQKQNNILHPRKVQFEPD